MTHIGIVIEPDTSNAQTRAIEWEDDRSAFRVMKEALNDGFLECIRLADDLLLWCDEEGKMRGLDANATATYWVRENFPTAMFAADYLVGPVIITGDDRTPNTVGLSERWLQYFRSVI